MSIGKFLPKHPLFVLEFSPEWARVRTFCSKTSVLIALNKSSYALHCLYYKPTNPFYRLTRSIAKRSRESTQSPRPVTL